MTLRDNITHMGEISGISEQSTSKQSFFGVVKEIITGNRRAPEFLVSQIMMALEIYHDNSLYPEKYGLSPNQVAPLPNPNTDPIAAWAIDHIGDIWEISVGFTVMRLGFVAANEALKKIPATKGYQIPDEACFWASLTSAVVVTATHSLGMWAGPYNSHVGNPVPEMIFGQGVAAVVLAATHYTTKYHESIKNLALRVGSKILKSGSLNEEQNSDNILVGSGRSNDYISMNGNSP